MNTYVFTVIKLGIKPKNRLMHIFLA